MTPAQFRRHLDRWHITPYRFARIANIRPSTVGRWLDGTSAVPGYAACIVGLIDRLPGDDQQEILYTVRRVD